MTGTGAGYTKDDDIDKQRVPQGDDVRSGYPVHIYMYVNLPCDSLILFYCQVSFHAFKQRLVPSDRLAEVYFPCQE